MDNHAVVIPARLVRFEARLARMQVRLRRRHPGLGFSFWSHSVGEHNKLDGWSLGIEVAGLFRPLELESLAWPGCSWNGPTTV